MAVSKNYVDTVKNRLNVDSVEDIYEKIRKGDETAFNEAVSLHRIAFDNLVKALKERFTTISDTDIEQCCYIGLYEAILNGRKGYNYTTAFVQRATRKAELMYQEEKKYYDFFTVDNYNQLQKEKYEIDTVPIRNARNDILYQIIKENLSPIHQYVLIRRYGLDGGKEWSGKELAQKIGFTRSNGYELIQRAERKIYIILLYNREHRRLVSPDFHIKDLWDNIRHQDTDKYIKAYSDLARKAYHIITTEDKYSITGLMKNNIKPKPKRKQIVSDTIQIKHLAEASV